jgi:hypothetical protein
MSGPERYKGQLSSADALIANVIFALILVFLVVFWYVAMGNIGNVTAKNSFEKSAVTITDIMLKSPGTPQDWENDPSSVETIGLAADAGDHNVLSRKKIENFTTMDYNATKEVFGLDEMTEYYFLVEDLGGNVIYEGGNSNVAGRSTVISIVRFAVLGEGGRITQPVRMRLMLYGAE